VVGLCRLLLPRPLLPLLPPSRRRFADGAAPTAAAVDGLLEAGGKPALVQQDEVLPAPALCAVPPPWAQRHAHGIASQPRAVRTARPAHPAPTQPADSLPAAAAAAAAGWQQSAAQARTRTVSRRNAPREEPLRERAPLQGTLDTADASPPAITPHICTISCCRCSDDLYYHNLYFVCCDR